MNYQDLEKPRQYEVLILDDNEFDGKTDAEGVNPPTYGPKHN